MVDFVIISGTGKRELWDRLWMVKQGADAGQARPPTDITVASIRAVSRLDTEPGRLMNYFLTQP